jgi:integrase
MSIRHKLQLHPSTGKYYVRVQRSGVSKNKWFTKDKRESQSLLLRFEKELAAEKVALFRTDPVHVIRDDGSKDMRVDTLAHLHLEWVKNHRSQGTYENRRFFVLIFLDYMGEAMVSEITRMKLEEFYIHARTIHQRGDGRNAGNECMSHVKTMLRWADERECVDLTFHRFPVIERKRPLTKRLTDEEVSLILSSADDDLKDLVHFGLLTGLRPIELRNLKQEHLRHAPDDSPYVFIEHHKTSESSKEPKPRSVPLCKQAKSILEQQMKKHPLSDYFFLNDAGTPYDSHVLGHRLRRLGKRIGLKKSLCAYSFRHTFASLQSDANVETNSLMSLMGHSTTRTLQRYVANTYSHHREAVERNADRIGRMIQAGQAECKLDAKVTTKVTTEQPLEDRPSEAAIATRSNPAS